MPSDQPVARARRMPVHLLLFLATVASVFFTSLLYDPAANAAAEAVRDQGSMATWLAMLRTKAAVLHATEFTATLMTILVAHEFGHYFAARLHRVPASLPYFIPLPLLAFGTMGAVIRMKDRIASRRALLDIGAAGPLAGLVFAIPLYVWGVRHSDVVKIEGPVMHLGESLLLRLLDRLAGPPIPEGMDLSLSPIAFAAWAGMFVTMINLVPVGQLDGGHVAYALLGTKQDRIAIIVHRSMLALFAVGVLSPFVRDLAEHHGITYLGRHVGNAMFWLLWFQALPILGSLARPPEADEPGLPVRVRIVSLVGLMVLAGIGRERPSVFLWVSWLLGFCLLIAMEIRSGSLRPHDLFDHPKANDEPLGAVRTVIAVVTLAFFAALFMPTPIAL